MATEQTARTERFTPGPWKVCWADEFRDETPADAVALIEFGPGDWGGFWIVGHKGFRSDTEKTTRADPDADCRLIAAAPDLYAACKAAASILDDVVSGNSVTLSSSATALDAVLAAIRKAVRQ